MYCRCGRGWGVEAVALSEVRNVNTESAVTVKDQCRRMLT
jgi:hypothetical protein